MSRERLKYLYDIREAAERLLRFTRDKSLLEYRKDDLLRSAVERQFGIIGEALTQLHRRDAELAEKIAGYRQIIAFRNLLVHGYTEVDDEIVWLVLKEDLPKLDSQATKLLVDLDQSR